MNELALFAGAGGGLLASKLLGWNTVGAVEIEKYPRDRLLQRQDEGFLDQFPVWDDVRTFDGRPWRGLVDVISGGFPCQDISVAGKGGGLAGSRSGLWFEYQRIIEEIRPQFVFAENSPNLRTNGLDQIIEGLTGLGYVGQHGVLGAGHVGALHKRSRMWVVANAERYEQPREEPCCWPPGRVGRFGEHLPWNESWENALSRLRGVGHGVARVVDRTDSIRNGQVPAVVATAWDVLTHDLFTAEVRKDGSYE